MPRSKDRPHYHSRDPRQLSLPVALPGQKPPTGPRTVDTPFGTPPLGTSAKRSGKKTPPPMWDHSVPPPRKESDYYWE
jgi:hypothetical protein